MTATDMWRIADEDLHGAGYKTLVCCPENALTGDPAQFEGLIAVPFPHILRRVFGFFTSSPAVVAGTLRTFKATVGGAFTVMTGFVSSGGLVQAGNANILEVRLVDQLDAPTGEEATDTLGALYRIELNITAAGTVNDLGLAVMVTPIPGGGFQHQQ